MPRVSTSTSPRKRVALSKMSRKDLEALHDRLKVKQAELNVDIRLAKTRCRRKDRLRRDLEVGRTSSAITIPPTEEERMIAFRVVRQRLSAVIITDGDGSPADAATRVKCSRAQEECQHWLGECERLAANLAQAYAKRGDESQLEADECDLRQRMRHARRLLASTQHNGRVRAFCKESDIDLVSTYNEALAARLGQQEQAVSALESRCDAVRSECRRLEAEYGALQAGLDRHARAEQKQRQWRTHDEAEQEAERDAALHLKRLLDTEHVAK